MEGPYIPPHRRSLNAWQRVDATVRPKSQINKINHLQHREFTLFCSIKSLERTQAALSAKVNDLKAQKGAAQKVVSGRSARSAQRRADFLAQKIKKVEAGVTKETGGSSSSSGQPNLRKPRVRTPQNAEKPQEDVTQVDDSEKQKSPSCPSCGQPLAPKPSVSENPNVQDTPNDVEKHISQAKRAVKTFVGGIGFGMAAIGSVGAWHTLGQSLLTLRTIPRFQLSKRLPIEERVGMVAIHDRMFKSKTFAFAAFVYALYARYNLVRRGNKPSLWTGYRDFLLSDELYSLRKGLQVADIIDSAITVAEGRAGAVIASMIKRGYRIDTFFLAFPLAEHVNRQLSIAGIKGVDLVLTLLTGGWYYVARHVFDTGVELGVNAQQYAALRTAITNGQELVLPQTPPRLTWTAASVVQINIGTQLIPRMDIVDVALPGVTAAITGNELVVTPTPVARIVAESVGSVVGGAVLGAGATAVVGAGAFAAGFIGVPGAVFYGLANVGASVSDYGETITRRNWGIVFGPNKASRWMPYEEHECRICGQTIRTGKLNTRLFLMREHCKSGLCLLHLNDILEGRYQRDVTPIVEESEDIPDRF